MNYIKCFLLICLFPFLEIKSQNTSFAIGKGTTLICGLSKDSIFLASDTRETIIYSNGKKEKKYLRKIIASNNFCFAATGPTEMYQNGKTIFSFNDVVKSMIKSKATINSFDLDLTNMLNKTFDRLSDSLKISFIRAAQTHPLGIEIVCAGFKFGEPIMIIKSYKVQNNKKKAFKETRNFISRISSEQPGAMKYFGSFYEIENYIKLNPQFLITFTTNMYKNVCMLIKLEIDKHDDVGLPIELVSLKKSKYSFIDMSFCK